MLSGRTLVPDNALLIRPPRSCPAGFYWTRSNSEAEAILARASAEDPVGGRHGRALAFVATIAAAVHKSAAPLRSARTVSVDLLLLLESKIRKLRHSSRTQARRPLWAGATAEPSRSSRRSRRPSTSPPRPPAFSTVGQRGSPSQIGGPREILAAVRARHGRAFASSRRPPSPTRPLRSAGTVSVDLLLLAGAVAKALAHAPGLAMPRPPFCDSLRRCAWPLWSGRGPVLLPPRCASRSP